MALKNLFDMVKADRYTQDGREAIIKAQEAETEDATRRTYQIGEISQATGLQKTANGWVKPKNGKQPGAASKHDTDPQTYIVKKNDELRKMYLNEKDPAKKEAMKKALKKQASMMEPEPFSSTESKPDESARIAASKEARAKKSQELGQKAAGDFAKYKDLPPVQRKDALGAASHEGISIGLTQRSMEGMGWDLIQADDKVNVYGKPDGSKAIMKHDGKKITEVNYEAPGSKPDAADQRDQIGGEIKGNLEAAKYYFDKANSFSPTDPSYKTYMTKAKQYNDEAKAQADDNGFDFEEMHNSGITQAVNKYAEEQSKPAAEKPERFDYRSSLEKNPRDAFSFKGTVNHSIPINQYHYDELQNLASFMREEKATYQNALKNRAQALVDGHKANGDWEPKKEQALMDIAKAVGFDEELHKFIEEENRGYDLGYSEDSAPSLSEIVDRVYNIGEISEKTGLQKTAQGWKPPKETKFGKVKQNKEGQWGVQVKQGKGSDFLKHKSEKEASRALANYTAGYNTTERSKQDPHSDQARQVKHWDKEVEKIKKENRAEGRAAHAAQFQKPTAAPKLNQVEKVDGANRPYRIKGTQFYFDTPEEAETAIVAGTRGEGKTYAKPSSDPNINEIQNALGFKLDSEYAGKYSMDDFIKKTGKDEYGVRVWSFGTDSKGTLIDTIVEGYNKPDATIKKENGEWRLHYTDRDGKKMIVTPKGREWPTSDSAPRQLTGDCRIRIRKEKPALTGDTKIRVRK